MYNIQVQVNILQCECMKFEMLTILKEAITAILVKV